MIKGCHKRIVHLKDTDSDVFEEAYFILKPCALKKSEDDILTEAARLVNDVYIDKKQKGEKKKRLFVPLALLIGALLGGGAMLLVNLLLI